MAYTRQELLDGLNKAVDAKDFEAADEIAGMLDVLTDEPVDPLDLTPYTKDIPGDDGGAYYREKAEREAAEEAQRKELQKTVEKPTFLEEAHLAFDQGSNLVSDMNAVLTAALPSSTVSITFEGDNLLPTLRMGLGEDFEKLTYGERTEVLEQAKQERVVAEHQDTLTKQEVWGQDAVATGVGAFGKGVLDPSVLLPVGQSMKAMTAIGGAVGFTSGLASQAAKNEFDAANLAAYTTAGLVLPAAVTRTGQLLQKAPKAFSTSKEKLENTGKAIINLTDRRTPAQKSADAANKTLSSMEEEAARLVSKGIQEKDVLPLVKANLGYDDAKVATTLADADRPFTIPTRQEADEIVTLLDNPLYARSEFGRKVDALLQPISSRIGKIDKKLMVAIRDVDRRVHQRIGESSKEFQNFFNVGMKAAKSANPNWASLENALFNNNYAKAQQIAEESFPEIAESLPKIQARMEGLFGELKEAGVDVRYLDDFFPRSIKDREGLLQAVGSKEKSYIKKAIEAETQRIGKLKNKKNYVLSTDEQDEVINKVLMGYKPTAAGMKRLTGTRSIPYLEENLQRFYHSAPESLKMYSDKAIREIEKRRFFGKHGQKRADSEGLDYRASAGSLIRANTNLPSSTVNELEDLINARFDGEDLKMRKELAYGRDLQYMSLLGQLDSALVQVGDIASAFYFNGFRNVFASALGKKQLSAEDLGVIDNIAAELNSSGGFSELLDKSLRLSGFKFVDRLGKNTLIGSSVTKYRRMASTAKGREALEKQWSDVFGNETGALINELQSGQITDRVKTLIWNDLADVQPISLSEMPEVYLNNPNGRIFYSLKTYMIKQIDLLRNRSLAKMKAKDNKTKLEGLGDLARYLAIVGGGNASVGTVRDYYLSGGDERTATFSNFEDNFINSVGSIAFLNRYTVDRYLSQGDIAGALQSNFTPPFIKVGQDVLVSPALEILSIPFKEEADVEVVDKALKAAPVLGKLYYTFLGGGLEKAQERIDKEETKDRIVTGL